MKQVFIYLLLFCGTQTWAQQNLLDTSTWTLGNGSVSGFNKYGSDSENIRELGTDPYGDQSILWKGLPDGSTNTAEGGWSTPNIPIDHTKTYRFTVWVKKSNSFDGAVIFKSYMYDTNSAHSGSTLNGTISSNPIFESDDLPELNKWYLYVGFIHASNYTETVSIGGVYDPLTGTNVLASTDYKFTTSAVSISQNTSLYGSGNAMDSVYFFAPTIYEVNGQESTIAELLNPNGNSGGGGGSVWNTNGNDINYTDGNVGIGTSNPGTYKLAVNGNIHTKEVKVDLIGWADYVFKEGYPLPTLEEVENHIKEKGHLINIPSAAEVRANGIQLGEMNKLLLEKIEELTLYILEQDKNQKQLEERIDQLEHNQDNK